MTVHEAVERQAEIRGASGECKSWVVDKIEFLQSLTSTHQSFEHLNDSELQSLAWWLIAAWNHGKVEGRREITRAREVGYTSAK